MAPQKEKSLDQIMTLHHKSSFIAFKNAMVEFDSVLVNATSVRTNRYMTVFPETLYILL